jgi:hypothetical protein
VRVEYQAWEGKEGNGSRALQALRSSMAHGNRLICPFSEFSIQVPMPRIWGTPAGAVILLAEIYPTFKDQARSPCGEVILSAPTPCTFRPS